MDDEEQESLKLDGSFKNVERPECLNSKTYKLKNVPNGQGDVSHLYLTVCNLDGKPFEIFANSKDARVIGKINTLMITVSRQLRNDISLEIIAKDLLGIFDPDTAHFIAGSNGIRAESLEAHVGYILKNHAKTGKMDTK